MWQDPYSLTIALSKEHSARGQLYSDDGVGYGYEKGEYVWRDFEFSWNVKRNSGFLTASHKRAHGQARAGSKDQEGNKGHSEELVKEENAWAQKIGHVEIDQIVILGAPTTKPIRGALVRVGKQEVLHGVVHMQGVDAGSKEGGTAGALVLKLPRVRVVDDWEIEFF